MDDLLTTTLYYVGSILGGTYAAKVFSYYMSLRELKGLRDQSEFREFLEIKKLLTILPSPSDIAVGYYIKRQINKSIGKS